MTPWLSDSRAKRAAGWVVYGMGMVALFFLITFPYEQLQARVLAELSRSSGLAISAERWSLAWPAGLEWQDLQVTASGYPLVRVDRFRLSLLLSSVISGRPSLEGVVEIGGTESQGGKVRSRVVLASWRHPDPAQVTGAAEHVDLTKLGIPAVRKGRLGAEFDQRWEATPPSPAGSPRPLGVGQWQVELTGVQLEPLPIGPMTLPAVEWSSLKGRLQCREGTCRVELLEGRGPDGTLNGSGTLTLRHSLGTSELSLALTLILSQEFVQRAAASGVVLASPGVPLKFNLKGPLAKPHVTL